jgi:DNA-binding response OmpR family regulator
LRRQREYLGYATKAEIKKGLVVGDLHIDTDQREALFKGKPLELTHKEFEILLYLAENLGRAIGREQLFEHIWGYEMEFNSNSLDVYVYRVRKKLDGGPECADYIQTLRGFGYKMVSPAN